MEVIDKMNLKMYERRIVEDLPRYARNKNEYGNVLKYLFVYAVLNKRKIFKNALEKEIRAHTKIMPLEIRALVTNVDRESVEKYIEDALRGNEAEAVAFAYVLSRKYGIGMWTIFNLKNKLRKYMRPEYSKSNPVDFAVAWCVLKAFNIDSVMLINLDELRRTCLEMVDEIRGDERDIAVFMLTGKFNSGNKMPCLIKSMLFYNDNEN